MNKKIGLTIIGSLLLVSPLLASADTLSDLRAQVQSLLAQIAALQGQQGTTPAQDSDYPTGGPSATCPQLTVGLQRGSRDATTGGQVTDLQIFLANRYGVAEETLVTGYFGAITEQYVTRFQQEHGLPAFGLVGPITRAKIAEVCGGSVTPPPPPPSTGTLSASPTSGPAPLTVTFSAPLTDAQYTLDFGDRTATDFRMEEGGNCTYSGCNLLKSHVYTSPGTYTAILTQHHPIVCEKDVVPAGTDCNSYLRGTATITVNEKGGERTSCTYRSDSTGVSRGIVIDANAGFTECRRLCTVSRNEVYGLQDSGLCIYTDTHGQQTTERINGGPSSGITVTAPNGGEQWEIGQLNTVTWTPYSYSPTVQNGANDVSVYLMRPDSTSVGRVMDTGKASLHTYFNLDNYQKWAEPGQYYVYAKNNVTGASDKSDAPFTLLPRAVDLKVNGSDGPVTLSDNQAISVSIAASGTLSSCNINGVRQSPGGPNGAAIPVSSGPNTYNFYAYMPFGPGSSTAIYVTCYRPDGTTRGDSVQVNIGSGTTASVQVTSPNGGEKIRTGTSLPSGIMWSQTGLRSVSIALYRNDQFWSWLYKDLVAGGAIDQQSAPWVPGDGSYPFETGSAIYKIYITGQKADGSGYVDDKSDAPFSFVPQFTETIPTQTNPVTDSFSVSTPTVTAGQSVTFSWSSNLSSTDISYYGGGCYLGGLSLSVNNQELYISNGFREASGSIAYVPTATATYTLRCTSGAKDGSPSASKTVTVTVVSAPINPTCTRGSSTINIEGGLDACRGWCLSLNAENYSSSGVYPTCIYKDQNGISQTVASAGADTQLANALTGMSDLLQKLADYLKGLAILQ